MKKCIAAIVLIFISLAVFIPFASNNPDGLEKIAASLGVQEPQSSWHGLMSDYTLNAFLENYASTPAAGILETAFVLVAALVLGAAITKKNQNQSEKS